MRPVLKAGFFLPKGLRGNLVGVMRWGNPGIIKSLGINKYKAFLLCRLVSALMPVQDAYRFLGQNDCY